MMGKTVCTEIDLRYKLKTPNELENQLDDTNHKNKLFVLLIHQSKSLDQSAKI